MNQSNHPNPAHRPAVATAPGISIADFYHVFFRHKWKILLVFLAGIAGAVGYYRMKPPAYQSEARIFIRYVVDARSSIPSTESQVQIRSQDTGGNIINSEIEILTSLDLAIEVAEAVGPEKVLAHWGGPVGDGKDAIRAGGIIRSGISVEVPGRSSVLRILFRNPDRNMVQPVLNALVDTYLKRHVQIHEGVGVLDDYLKHQAEQVKTRLAQTEQELKQLKAEARIISLEDDRRGYTERMQRIQADLLAAEADLAERRATLQALTRMAATSNQAVAVPPVSVPPDVMERYRAAVATVASLYERRAELRARYWDEHFMVRTINAQVAEAEQVKNRLETENPSLTQIPVTLAGSTNQTVDLAAEEMRAASLEARIKVLNAQLEEVRTQANRVAQVEPAITQLERSREVDAANYRALSTRLQNARVDESMGVGKITNISVVQNSTPPVRDMKEIAKPLLMILAIGCFGGFAWGFVSDQFLNRTIKSVVDIERHLPVPLFVSVPDMSWKNGVRVSGFSPAAPLTTVSIPNGTNQADAVPQTAVGPWDPEHKLRPYYEGLRDRLITFFEVRNMRQKPKMVAVTGCAAGAGVTTMAAGLAASLSETGDGKVLLVDMNVERGAAHPFFDGKPGCALDEALESTTRDPALVHENLYLVTAQETNNEKLPAVLPKRFAHLVPKMKASDYDYIIFDMPPVTQTSVTARLAGYMDMVLMVVESEKTGQDILKRAHGLLNESKPNMAAVLNKHRAYVPAKFAQEL